MTNPGSGGIERASAQFFEISGYASTGASQDEWITAQLAAALPTIATDMLQHESEAGLCPLADVANYLLRILHIISQFSNRIAYGDFVHDYAQNNLELLVEQDDGSITNYLDEKHQALKSIADQLTLSSSLCRQILAEGPKTPCPLPPPNEPKGKGRVESSTRSISYDTPAGSSTMDGRSSLYDDVASIAVSASCGQNNAGPEDDFVQSLDHLKVRGSGQYTCPEGLSCKRGGVVDGNIRVFKRNSEFRAHLERHKRVYKCDLPGCPNKKGFARLDQLGRHKRDVKHHPTVTWAT